jgi:hypothetical protein
MKSSRPSGRSTRRTSCTAPFASATVQRTIVETTVSNEASSNGSRSAGAATTTAALPARATRRPRRLPIAASGSLSTSSWTASV